MMRLSLLIAASAALLGGCQHTPVETPAVLTDASDANISALKSALSEALGRSRVELGAGDPTVEPQVAILPPPLGTHEDRSPAKPSLFNLLMRDGICIAVETDTRAETVLTGVTCRAL